MDLSLNNICNMELSAAITNKSQVLKVETVGSQENNINTLHTHNPKNKESFPVK